MDNDSEFSYYTVMVVHDGKAIRQRKQNDENLVWLIGYSTVPLNTFIVAVPLKKTVIVMILIVEFF